VSRVLAIGASLELLGYGLAGAEVVDAPDPERVRVAWAGIGDDVGLVLLTQAARRALPDDLRGDERLWVVLPG
jgi:hypothetical protein